jgi:hypothetical protein
MLMQGVQGGRVLTSATSAKQKKTGNNAQLEALVRKKKHVVGKLEDVS